MAVSRKRIEEKTEYLNQLTGKNLYSEPPCGFPGWRLVELNELGGHCGVFGRSASGERMPAKHYYDYLDGSVEGILFAREQAKVTKK